MEPKLLESGISFKKNDFLSAVIIGEAVAWLLFIMAQVNARYLPLPAGVVNSLSSPWLLAVSFPILSVAGLYVFYFLGKKVRALYQVAKFALIGALNTFVDLGILNLLILLTGITSGFGFLAFKGVSFVIAVVNSYFWNKFWTFKSGRSTTQKEFFQFFVVSAIGVFLNVGVAYFIVDIIGPQRGLTPEIWANVGALIATFIVLVWNFIGYKLWVFKK
ncbi:MAG: hypothetical protein A2728_00485 [Candidatus Spechtbacteria bacterium RIFCSPHIGHO2_01_FULL_38_11]|nr:MAG: hypothetical protein A2728_00485 [Candidatus Spechtbacteria bacterium RIFCSPHIGHO2_01_FULL_38_11]